MPRDNDKNNGRPPRRESGAGGGYKGSGKSRPGGAGGRDGRSAGGGRSRDDRSSRPSTARGERKFGEKRPYSPRGERGDNPRPRFNRDDRPQRDERPSRGPRKEFGTRSERGEGRTFKPRDDRGGGGRSFKSREDRGEGGRSFKPRIRDDHAPRGERGESRPSRSAGPGRFSDKKFGEKRPYTPRGDGSRSRFERDERPRRDDRPARAPRRDFDGPDRGAEKPWQKRAPAARGSEERQRFSRPRFDKPREDRMPRGERPAGRTDWQEHPRSERRDRDDRPRRDNEDDSKVFAKRPAFGGRGAYRERKGEFDKRAPREAAPTKTKTGERIAKIVARAGLCSRRDAEEWIVQGRVAVNGRVINSPALDITESDVVTIDGKPLPERERTRLFLYHKPRGLMTTHDDPEGRPTVFDNLPEGLPRLISVGRLDFNTEGLLLLTNDGGLARALELPDTGWLRRYRVRAHGEVTQAQLDQLKKGVEVDGVKYGSIDATLERDQGANVWIVFAIREGKNREVRNVMAHLGLEVNRLIRVSYGPFQLGEIEEGQVEEIKSRVLREQLGEKIATMSGAQFDKPVREISDVDETESSKIKKRPKALGKNALIADSKGRRVLVTRTGSDEKRAQNEDEANGYGAPRRPQRGYKGKRDLKPRED